MSDSLGPHDHNPDVNAPLLDEFYALAAGHADEQLSLEEKQRLESLLVDHGDLCDRFLDYMQMMSALENESTQLREYLAQGTDISDNSQDTSPSVIPSFDIKGTDALMAATNEEKASSRELPVLGFLGSCMKSGLSFLSRPNVLSLLLAVGLPSLILAVLAIQLAEVPTPQHSVATITRTHECVWRDVDEVLSEGTSLFAGERLQLTKGLLEISYAQGVTVLLEGPATFNVTDGVQGFLRDGSLVAKVRKGAEGFTIQTPAIDVVDLGTEFGVCVDDKKGTAKVEVFQGKVELQATNKKQPNRNLRESLVAGQAVRVEVATRHGTLPIIRKITPITNTFVRCIPVSSPIKLSVSKEPKVVIADFSGGKGNSQVDQFPGIAGSGWATGWRVEKTKHYKWFITVEQSNSLLSGGNYLHALLERESGSSNDVEGTHLERQLAMADGVDLTKPYVISFNYRIDNLDQFPKQGEWLTLCSRCMRKSKNADPNSSTSGWHISSPYKSNQSGQAGNWFFWFRNKAGNVAGVDSGIPIQEGDTYSFRILVDPTVAQWTPSIAVNGGKWTEFEPMGMRSGGTAKQNDYWPFLHFFYRMVGGNKGEDVEKIGFSIDSIIVTPK